MNHFKSVIQDIFSLAIRMSNNIESLKNDKQDHQGKAAFNERSPHPTQ
jgi:hypothetical protein